MTLSRRDVSKSVICAAGVGLLAPGIAIASVVTPQQVEGPFHPISQDAETDVDLTQLEGREEAATGEVILVRGRVMDVAGNPLDEAVVDVWQANHFGRYSHPEDPNTAPLDPNFQGWGIMQTATDGRYGFKTVQPGAYPLSFLGEEGWRCRHIHFKVSCPGFATLTTQMYFEGDPLIPQDLEIAKAPEARRHLLICSAQQDPVAGLPLYTFDVVLAAG